MPNLRGSHISCSGFLDFVLQLHCGCRAANQIESLCLRHHCAAVLLNMSLYFRTVSAQGFEYDDLYVTAHLELPECKCCNARFSLSVFCHFAQRKINFLFLHFVVQSGWLRKTQVNLSPLSLRFAKRNQNIRYSNYLYACAELVPMQLPISLVPRPLPDFISQPWRKIGRRPGIKTTSRTGNGGLGLY